MRIGLVVLTYNKKSSTISEPFREVLHSIQSQKFSGHIDVLFVDNLSSRPFIETIHKFCSKNSKDNITFSYVSESKAFPMYSSWNLGLHVFKTRGSYDALGVSSDNDWLVGTDALQGAIDEFQDPSVGIVSVLSEFDSTVRLDNGEYAFPRLLEPGDTPLVLSIDEIIHLHVGFFSSYYLKEYDYRYPDVMLSFGPGSLPGFFCRVIRKTWTLTRSSVLANGSFRYPPNNSGNTKRVTKRMLAARRRRRALKADIKSGSRAGFSGFLIDPSVNKTFEQLMLPGRSVGLGFQTWQRFAKLKGLEGMGGYWVDYDPSFYDEEGKHKNPEILKKYLKENMFIPVPDYEGRLKNSIQYLNM